MDLTRPISCVVSWWGTDGFQNPSVHIERADISPYQTTYQTQTKTYVRAQ